jgi:hippurate hydrolase
VREEGIPATVNDENLTQRLMTVHQQILGETNVIRVDPLMVGEDFSLYGRTKEKVPICIFWLGTISESLYQAHLTEGKPLPTLHSAEYAPDPLPSIRTGIVSMTGAALELLGKP